MLFNELCFGSNFAINIYTLLHFKICTLKCKKKIVERSAVAQIQKNVRINGIHAKTVQAL